MEEKQVMKTTSRIPKRSTSTRQFLGVVKLLSAVVVAVAVGGAAEKGNAQSLNNGGFESGLSGWTVSGSFYHWTNSARAHSGSQYAYFGVAANGTTPLTNGAGSIYQTVTIPAGATSATLSFWLWVASDESATIAFDFLYVELLNTSGSLISTPATYSNQDKSGAFNSTTPAYQEKSLSLLSYAGQTLRIRFRGTTDPSYATIFRLDDVSLTTSVTPPAVTVASPNGGENWTAGTSQNVTWSVSGSTANIAYFKIALSTDGGVSYSTDLTPSGIYDPSARSWSWSISSALNTSQARIRVRALDASANILAQDASDGNFTIQPPDGRFYLSFPLADVGPYSASISSVFDHSMTTPYCPDGVVTAYTGETGTVFDPNEPYVPATCGNLYSYKKPDGSAFVVNGHYIGTQRTGPTTLNYDGHSGIDYPVPIGTEVIGAAGGVLRWIVGSRFNTIYIDHGNGYATHYLHLSQRLVADGAQVTRGQRIALSGEAGVEGSPHLHFEVKLNNDPVDPYGWSGAVADPYVAATSVNLWDVPPLLGFSLHGNKIVLTWPAEAAGFGLESSTSLPGAVWSPVSPAPVIVSGKYTVTNTISGAANFYRLRKPTP
jgi:murein DD-endopeptidase MepM/ murein hydrolase activator NlpD